jgi:EmrB/QacA subfamily drug resistance transporter
LAVIAVTQLTIVLDATIVTVALPDVQRALGFTNAGLQWVVTAYTLVFGGLLLLGGRVSDTFGRRQMLMVGMTLFTAASMAGGFAGSPGWLIGARVVQGVGGALLAPTTLALIVENFDEGAPRTRAMSVWAAMSAFGGAVGLIAGGLLTTYASWRWTLFVNVPIGMAVVIAAPLVLARSRHTRRRIDLAGAVTATGAIAALIYGLTAAAPSGPGDVSHWWSAKVSISLGVGALLLVAFLLTESRVQFPLMPLRVLQDRNRAAAYLSSATIGVSFFGVLFFLTMFLQNVWGYTPIEAGLAYVPWVAVFAVAATISGRLLPMIGPKALLLIGASLAASGLLWLSFLAENSSYLAGVVGPIVLTPFGFGLMVVPITTLGLSGVDDSEAGVASSLLNVAQQVGASIGVAGLGTIAWTVVSNRLDDAPGARGEIYQQALADGFDRGFLVTACVALVGVLVALLVRPTAPPSSPTGTDAVALH